MAMIASEDCGSQYIWFVEVESRAEAVEKSESMATYMQAKKSGDPRLTSYTRLMVR